MAEIRALIVDDEPLARRGIRQLLARHSDVTVAAECRNGREVLRSSQALAFDLMFLDVQMPGLSGFDVIRQWSAPVRPVIVFVTAYEEFAVRAFEACALDYLVKPVTEKRFETTMTRVRERIRLGDASARVEQLQVLLAEKERGAGQVRSAALVVITPQGRLVLDPGEVDWIEARDYCACLHVGERSYLVRESLRSLERRLRGADFVRVHRGAIVRLPQIREIRTRGTTGATILLRDGTRIPLSRRRREPLARILRART
jgi:two-component system LytT family response regulator